MISLPALSASVNTLENPHTPESFELSSYKATLQVSPDFVVSRGIDGKVLSVYQDIEWDWTLYNLGKRLVFRYEFEIDDSKDGNDRYAALAEELKLIFFLYLYSPVTGTSGKHHRTQVKLSCLKAFAAHAYEKRLTMAELFEKPKLIAGFLKKNKIMAISILPIITGLNYYHSYDVNHPFQRITRPWLQKIARIGKESYKNNKQTPVIPSGIYSKLLDDVGNRFDSYKPAAHELIEYFNERINNPAYGMSHSNQKYQHNIRENFFPTLNEIITNSEVLRPYLLDAIGDARLIRKLISFLIAIQSCCAARVCLFSGMRIGEILLAPYYGGIKTTIEGVDHYLIKGFAEKRRGKQFEAEVWVTNKEGYEAFELAGDIAEVIYKSIGVEPIQDENEWHKTPMFISASFLPGGVHNSRVDLDHIRVISKDRVGKHLNSNFIYHIGLEDFEELSLLDPHRDWGAEDGFKVGDRWHFTSRQFRRTLAVYAQRSGLVSIPSLRRQLKHLGNEMSLYYAQGSPLAPDMVGGKESFAKLYRKTKPESELMAMLKNFLFSDQRFFGAIGTFAKKNEGFSEQIIGADRNETLKRFERGELGYKETPFGACGEVAQCDKKAMRSITGCLSCSKSIISIDKLERTIKRHDVLVESLDKDTVYYRIEQADLEAMNKTLTKIKKGQVEAA